MLDKVAKFLPLNFQLLGNPVNWIIVFLMLALAGMMLGTILSTSTQIIEE